MTMARNALVLLAALWSLEPMQPMKAAENCPDLQGKDDAARLEYLRGDRSKLTANCIVAGIKSLEGKRHAQASQVLIRYLDYHEPDHHDEGKWAMIPYAYPAVDALYSLGKLVVPELIAVISDASGSDLVRRNAAWAILLMYGAGQPEGIVVLVSAAHAQADPGASLRLMDQARWFAARCALASRNECENAVLK